MYLIVSEMVETKRLFEVLICATTSLTVDLNAAIAVRVIIDFMFLEDLDNALMEENPGECEGILGKPIFISAMVFMPPNACERLRKTMKN